MRIVDLHNDAITAMSFRKFKKYIKRAEKAGVGAILVSVWTTEMAEPLQRLKGARRAIDRIKTKVELLLHIEDAGFINEKNINEVLKLSPFSVGLSWNYNNNLAGGALDDGSLTELGAMIVRRLVNRGIAIDLAHLNGQSFSDIAQLLKERETPLFCSHTCFEAICSNPRNLAGEQMKAIVESGGIIGLSFVGEFLKGGRATMEDVYMHVKYFVDNFGDDNLAIGTDFFGTENLPIGLCEYEDFKDLKKYLLQRGIPDSTIYKIFHINAHDYIRRIKCRNQKPKASWWDKY